MEANMLSPPWAPRGLISPPRVLWPRLAPLPSLTNPPANNRPRAHSAIKPVPSQHLLSQALPLSMALPTPFTHRRCPHSPRERRVPAAFSSGSFFSSTFHTVMYRDSSQHWTGLSPLLETGPCLWALCCIYSSAYLSLAQNKCSVKYVASE